MLLRFRARISSGARAARGSAAHARHPHGLQPDRAAREPCAPEMPIARRLRTAPAAADGRSARRTRSRPCDGRARRRWPRRNFARRRDARGRSQGRRIARPTKCARGFWPYACQRRGASLPPTWPRRPSCCAVRSPATPGAAQDVLALNAGAAIYVGGGADRSPTASASRARDSRFRACTRYNRTTAPRQSRRGTAQA